MKRRNLLKTLACVPVLAVAQPAVTPYQKGGLNEKLAGYATDSIMQVIENETGRKLDNIARLKINAFVLSVVNLSHDKTIT